MASLTRPRAVPPTTSWQSSVASRVMASKKSSSNSSPKLAKLFERELVQLATCLKAQPNRIADLLVRLAEGNSLVGEVGRGGHRIQIAASRRQSSSHL